MANSFIKSLDSGRQFIIGGIGVDVRYVAGQIIALGTRLVGMCVGAAGGANVIAADALLGRQLDHQATVVIEHEAVLLDTTADADGVFAVGDPVNFVIATQMATNALVTQSGTIVSVGHCIATCAEAEVFVQVKFNGISAAPVPLRRVVNGAAFGVPAVPTAAEAVALLGDAALHVGETVLVDTDAGVQFIMTSNGVEWSFSIHTKTS